MEANGAFHWLKLVFEIFFVDLLLSGDNAVVIALACRSLPTAERRRGMLMGGGAAIVLRVVLTLFAAALLRVSTLKLVGGIALVFVAIRLSLKDDDPAVHKGLFAGSGGKRGTLLSVIGMVVIADTVMGVDNIVALAAVGEGDGLALAVGLLLSIPLLMFSSWQVLGLIERYPQLGQLGGALLGWLAGAIAISDPLYVSWVRQQSPALQLVVPGLAALYVVLQSRIIEDARHSAAALRPVNRLRPEKAQPATSPEALPSTYVLPDPAELQSRNGSLGSFKPAWLATAAPPNAGPRPPIPKRSKTPGSWALPNRTHVLVGLGGVACLASGYWFVSASGSSGSFPMTRYECRRPEATIFYHPGGRDIRLTAGSKSVSGQVQERNQIDWGDYHQASMTLGFVPPTQITYADADALRIDGGMFPDVTCSR